jgi:peroxiredoxin
VLEAVPPPEAVEGGRNALEAARRAYRRAGAFQEVLDFVVTFPDGRREEKREEYGVDEQGAAFLVYRTDGKETFRIVARGARAVATLEWVKDRYAEALYAGQFAAALQRMGGAQASIAAPPAVVARQGGSERDFLEALQMGVLKPLKLVGSSAALAADGAPLLAIELRAENGRESLRVDAKTHRLRDFTLALGEGAQQLRIEGHAGYSAGAQPKDFTLPDLSGRAVVGTLGDLQAESHPIGEEAPALRLAGLAGGTVGNEDFRGSVVVLDFWATWCVPCWTGLARTAELASWAKRSGLAVKVFAVDTLERASSLQEQRKRAEDFLRSKKLDLPVLLDYGSKAFEGFHSPGLPSVIVLDQNGRVARYHNGLLENMAATLQKDVEDLLRPK